MIIHQKIGNIATYDTHKQTDVVLLEWFETNKRIWHKKTTNGTDISFKCLSGPPLLMEGDVLCELNETVVVVDIIPTETLMIYPANNRELVSIVYEIGNKHLPLFYEDEILMTAFDLPLYRQLQAQGYLIKETIKKLSQPLSTTVIPHNIPLLSGLSSGL